MFLLRVHSTLLKEFEKTIREKSKGKFWIEVENDGFGKWKLMSKLPGWHSINRITEEYFFNKKDGNKRVEDVAIDTTTDTVLISYMDYLNENRFCDLDLYVLVATKEEDTITKYIYGREEMYYTIDSLWKDGYRIEICDQILAQKDIWEEYTDLKKYIAMSNSEKEVLKLAKKNNLDIDGLEEYIRTKIKGR